MCAPSCLSTPVCGARIRNCSPSPASEQVPHCHRDHGVRVLAAAARYPGHRQSPVYFIDCPALFDRPDLYTTDPDEHRRFLLFTRAAIESCRRLEFAPHIFPLQRLAHGIPAIVFEDALRLGCRCSHTPSSLMTIHNIGYQGIMPSSAAADLGLASSAVQLDQGDLAFGVINSLKTGIKFADEVSTVSPTYAREICDSAARHGVGVGTRRRAQTGSSAY